MNKLTKFGIILILIISSFYLTNNSRASTIFSDNFDENALNTSVWTKISSTYMDIQDKNGMLQGVYTGQSSQVSEWRIALVQKGIHISSGLQIDLDYQFNFQKLGQIFLWGRDINATINRWVVGYSDPWSASNGVPETFSYLANGSLSPESYPVSPLSRQNAQISVPSGSGHITVSYVTNNEINATITYPSRSVSTLLPQSGPIDSIVIDFEAYGSANSPSDIWHVDNYTETDSSQITSNFTTTTSPTTTIPGTQLSSPSSSQSSFTPGSQISTASYDPFFSIFGLIISFELIIFHKRKKKS